MDLGAKARRIERTLTRTVDAALGELVGRDDPAPLEIVHAVLDRAGHEVIDIGRGRCVFPFTRVTVQIADGRDREARARFDAVMTGPPSLAERLEERLAAAGCPNARVTVKVAYVAAAGSAWQSPRFNIVFDRAADVPAAPAAAASASVAQLKLTVVKGRASQRVYMFAGGRIDIGRRAEVVDQRQRVIRTNHIAFSEDGAEENASVSRRHAHVAYSEADAGYRVWDDRSAQGTSIIRAGRTIRVPSGARGTRLASGDEIVLGRARLKVTLDPG